METGRRNQICKVRWEAHSERLVGYGHGQSMDGKRTSQRGTAGPASSTGIRVTLRLFVLSGPFSRASSIKDSVTCPNPFSIPSFHDTSTTEMSDTTYKLRCFVEGSKTPFSVIVPSTISIGELQKIIKIEKCYTFERTDASSIPLWKVRCISSDNTGGH
jgi:hypothetical protein